MDSAFALAKASILNGTVASMEDEAALNNLPKSEPYNLQDDGEGFSVTQLILEAFCWAHQIPD